MRPSLISVFTFLLVSIPAVAQFQNTQIAGIPNDQGETAVSVSPIDPNYIVGGWNDNRDPRFIQPGYAFSIDGGANWSSGVIVHPNPDYTDGFDPSVAFDRYGNAFYCYIASGRFEPYYLGPVCVSRTSSFPSPSWTFTRASTTEHLQDKPFMTIDNTGGDFDGRIYVSWTNFDDYSIRFAYSNNSGGSFHEQLLASGSSTPGVFTQFSPREMTDPLLGNIQGSMPAVGPNGEVYVIWMEVDETSHGFLKLKKSTDGGETFGTTAIQVAPFSFLNDQVGCLWLSNLPSIAVGPNEYIYVAYTDLKPQSPTERCIKWVRSADGGSNWTPPTVIGNVSSGWQFFPSVAVDANGRVSVSFVHSSDLATVDLYVTVSLDDGGTFPTTRRVTNQTLNPSIGFWHQDYWDIDANAGHNKTFLLWSDFRSGNPDPFFASPMDVVPSVPAGWGMTSIPVRLPSRNMGDVYPGVSAFDIWAWWNGGYSPALNPLDTNQGYWINFEDPRTIHYMGDPIVSTPMPVVQYWNIIGSISYSVPTSSVVQTPPSIVASQYFEYHDGYQIVTTLEPGWGHWVKANQAGTLTLQSSGMRPVLNGVPFADLDKFTITSDNRGKQDLFVRNGGLSSGGNGGPIEMPPEPPGGGFDCRFSSGNILEEISPSQGLVQLPLNIRSGNCPVTFSWNLRRENNLQYWFLDHKGRSLPLDGVGSIHLGLEDQANAAIQTLAGGKSGNVMSSVVSPVVNQVPIFYALQECFPNPFNPSTQIKFDLPEEAQVLLIVYDVLGREVANLASGYREAGYHSVTWNATDQSSGVYLARFNVMNAEGRIAYSKINKLLLMK